MNLLSIQDNLKGVSDQDLARMMQSPDSTAPSYLVLSEIRRRKDMRTKAGDMPSSTVAEDLVDIPQTYSDREGIRGLRVPGYEEEQQDEEADSGAGIEAMRAGGVVRMAEGGEPMAELDEGRPNLPLPLPPRSPPSASSMRQPSAGAAPRADAINMQDIMRRNMELIPGIPEELMNRLREGRTNEPERRREAQSNALVEAGLRIAASNNPRLAGAIGEGALPAVQGYTQQRAQIRQDQRADLQSEMAAAQADIQRRYMAGQLSAAEYRSAMAEAGAYDRTRMQLAAQAGQQATALAREELRHQNTMERARADENRRLYMSAAQEATRLMGDLGRVGAIRGEMLTEARRTNPNATIDSITNQDVQNRIMDNIMRTYETTRSRFGSPGSQGNTPAPQASQPVRNWNTTTNRID